MPVVAYLRRFSARILRNGNFLREGKPVNGERVAYSKPTRNICYKTFRFNFERLFARVFLPANSSYYENLRTITVYRLRQAAYLFRALLIRVFP